MANLFARERFNPQAQKTSFQQIEDIARQSRVPVNVLLAMGEKAKVETPEDLVEFSRTAAGELGPVIQSGGDIEQIIRQSAGDQADSFLARAREIGHELYPERMNPGQAQRNAEAAAQGRRSIGENIRLGVPQVPEGIVGGLGRTAKFLGFDAAGDAIIDFAENTFGMSEKDQARSAAIAEDSTIGQEVVDGFFQAGPGILVDIAMSWAGAKTGAKIGAIAGPKGAVVGGIVGAVAGAAASIFPQMVSSAWQTAEANGFDTEDQGVQFDIMKTALATSAAQTVFPAAVGRMLQKPINVAAEGVARSVIQRAAAGGAIGSATEGMAEVAALVLEQIMFDKDVQASLDAEGWKAVGPMLIEKFGREAIVTFGIGALMGGAIGGPAAAVTRSGANAQIDADGAQAQDGAFGAIFERAQDIEPGSIQGVSAADHSAFMRGVLNEINGVEAGLTDADGNYDAQGRTARQQRAYDKGVAWANEQAGDIADGIKTRADESVAQAQAEAAAEEAAQQAPLTAAIDERAGTDEQDTLAAQEPKPGSLAYAAMEGARRTAPVQPDTGVGLGVSPAAGMPGGGPQASEASVAAAAPQDGTTGQPAPVVVQFDSDPAPFDAEIVSEGPDGLQIMDVSTGEVWNVPREDIEAGLVQIGPRDSPTSMSQATQAPQGEAIPPEPDQYEAAVQEFGAIADNLTSIGQAERTLADLGTIANEFGEGEDLRAIREQIERYIEQQEAQQRDAEAAERAEDSQVEGPDPQAVSIDDDAPLGSLGAGVHIQPEADSQLEASKDELWENEVYGAPTEVRRKDGSVFSDDKTPIQRIRSLKLDPADYDIVPRDGGFVAVRKTDAAPDTPDVQQEAQQDRQPSRIVGADPAEQAQAEARERLRQVAQIADTLPPEQRAIYDQMVKEAQDSDDNVSAVRAGILAEFTGRDDDVLQPASRDSKKRMDQARQAARERLSTTPTTGEQTDGIQQGQQEGLQQQGREEEVARPTAEDFPDLNFESTGGQFGTKRTYPGFVVSRNDSGGLTVRRESNGELIGGARDMDGVRNIMATQRNPFTGEPFLKPAQAKKESKKEAEPTKESADPVEDAAIAGVQAGIVSHTTKKGKNLSGYVVKGIDQAQAKELDPYTFKKDGGWFVRENAMRGALPADKRPDAAKSDTPTAEQIDQIAAETDPNPTPAQAEAENYKTGKTEWRGLRLSFENRKGTDRKGIGRDGKEWSVTMPAHYGRILRTEGADGDHVDFYMGDNPDSDRVFVVDQKDAETGAFDEHKVMLGFNTQKEAKDAYLAGFNDGKGEDRWGGVTAMSVADLGQIIGDKAKWQNPMKMQESKGQAETHSLTQTQRDVVSGANRAVKPENKDGTGFYTSGSIDVQIDPDFNGDASIEVTETRSWFEGRQRKTETKNKRAKFSDVRDQLRQPALGIIEAIAAQTEAQEGATTAAQPASQPKPKSSTGADRAMDIDRLKAADFDAFDDKTREDGQMSPAKRLGRDETGRWARSLVKVLKDNGWTPVQNAKGKKVKEVDFGYAMSSEFDDTKINLTAPNGLELFLKIGTPWNRGQTFNILVQFRGDPERPGYSKSFVGPNRYLPENLTPAEAAAQLNDMAERLTPKPEAETAPKATEAPTAPVPESAPTETPQADNKPKALTWADFDERSDNDPKMPAGYELTVIRRMTKQEAEAEGYQWPAYKAVVKRDTPAGTYKVVDGISENSRSNAIAVALEKAKQGAETPAPQAAPTPDKPASGILSALSQEKQDRAAELKARLAAKVRNQTSSGLDPEYITLGGELVALYVEAGTKRFAQILRDFAETTGLTMREAQAPMRAAYNHYREEMDLAGQDVSDFDTSEQVMAEIRAALASEAETAPSTEPAQSDTVETDQQSETLEDDVSPKTDDQGGVAETGAIGGEGITAETASGPDADSGGSSAGDRGNEGADANDQLESGLVGSSTDISETPQGERSGVSPGNFVIDPDFPLGEGTDGQKIAANMAALRLVKQLDAENRYATPEEQAVLARYVGWGGLKMVFDPRVTGATTQWGRAQAELKELVTREEYAAMRRSTENAHFTSRTVVNAMWKAMQRFGFDGGRALEPTVGTGNFLGLMPADLSGKTDWFAAELDNVTGAIARHLYPDAVVMDGMGFQNAPFRAGSMDVAIGNPPFSRDPISSKLHPEIPEMSLHNYIIAKTGLLLREGGIMGMVVTNRFLDLPNQYARSYLARNFDFVGAVRLPNTAFKANAGTEVTTDIVWFQKRREGEPRGDLSWLEAGAQLPGTDVTLNSYFAQNPDMMLGRPGMDGTMRGSGPEFTLHDDGRDLSTALDQALAKLQASLPDRTEALQDAVVEQKPVANMDVGDFELGPDGKVIMRGIDTREGEPNIQEVTAKTPWGAGALEMERIVRRIEDTIEATESGTMDARRFQLDALAAELRESGLFTDDNQPKKTTPTGFVKALDPALAALSEAINAEVPYFGRAQKAALKTFKEELGKKQLGKRFPALKGLLDLRKRFVDQLRAEREDSPNIEKMRADLRKAYTGFVKKHGFVNNPANAKLVADRPGVEFGLEESYTPVNKKEGIEEAAKPASILRKRLIEPYSAPDKADNAADGLHISLRERGRLDLPFIARLTGQDVAAVKAELTEGEKPLAFYDPKLQEYVIADEYLSGNLMQKIKDAEGKGYDSNVRALRAALPPKKTKEQVNPSIRSQWLPTHVLTDFMSALGIESKGVTFIPEIGKIVIESPRDGALSAFGEQFKTERRNVSQVFEAAISGKSIAVYDKIDEKQVKNQAETEKANLAVQRMSEEFEKWAYSNPERAQDIVDAFNEKVNVVVERKFDGVSYLRTVGANPHISLRDTQKNGAWRMIQQARTLMHHVVGAGKTMTAITAIMERKRLGLSKKSMVVVPNHLVEQWGREFRELYPGANILVAHKDDFAKDRRRKMFARIASGDYDAVIIGHSQIRQIENNPKEVENIINEQLDALEKALEAAKASGESKRSAKQIQDQIDKLKDSLTGINEKLKADDLGITFSDMGIDNIVVDEAHEFKNLQYATGGERLVGMNSPAGSQRAFDLYVKLRGMQAKGHATHFLTGTPVSNSLVEIYTMMKYLGHDTLKSMNLDHFDAWSSAFIKDEKRIEWTPAMTLKERRVIRGVINAEALSRIYKEFADILMRPDVERIYAQQVEKENKATGGNKSTRFPTPKVKGGGRQLVLVPSGPMHQEFTQYLVMRAEGIARNPPKDYAATDNMLWVLSDARKASIDIRTIDPTLKRMEDSKVVYAGNKLIDLYNRYDDVKGTQLVFADSSVPMAKAKKDLKPSLLAGWKVAGLKEADAKARVAADDGNVSALAQYEAITEEIDRKISEGEFNSQQQDRAEAWLDSDAADDLRAMAMTSDYGFSFYDDLRAYLAEQGIPEGEVAFIHEHDTPQKKQDLFAAVKSGEVRILIGSTFKMGAGMNVQERMVAIHHIDAPWRPSDMEQREGRGIRQGNKLYEADPEGFEFEIYAYTMEQSSDTVLWQVLERKATGIESFMSSTTDTVMEEGEGDADSYASFMAQSTGNPVFIEKMQAEKDLAAERALISNAAMIKGEAQNWLGAYDRRRADMAASIKRNQAAASAPAISGQAGQTYRDYDDAMLRFDAALEAHQLEVEKVRAENEALPKGEKKKLLPKFQMERPTIYPDGAQLDPWASSVKQAIEGLKGQSYGSKKLIPIYDRYFLEIEFTAKGQHGGHSAAIVESAQLGESERIFVVQRLGETSAQFPLESRSFMRAIRPENISAQFERMARNTRAQLSSLEAMKPEMEQKAKATVNYDRLNQIEERVNILTGMTRIAEVEAAKDRIGKPNRFASMDDKGRDLAGESSENAPVYAGQNEAPFKVQIDGKEFTAPYGAKGQKIIEGRDAFDTLWMQGEAADGTRKLIKVRAKSYAQNETPPADMQPIGDAGQHIKVENSYDVDSESRFDADPALTPASTRDVTRAVNAELRRSVPNSKVTAKVVRGLVGASGAPIQGRQRGAQIEVNPDSADGVIGTLRHEIVHALRDAGLWGKPYGLFTRAEWQGLVAAARSDTALMERIDRMYDDLSETARLEEGVAELYRLWARNMDQRSGLDRAFQKMRALFEALASAFRGQGFNSTALTFERIASGRVGGRGPDGPSGRSKRGARDQRAFHGSPHDFDRFSTAFMGTGEGAQAFDWGLYFAGRKDTAEGYRRSIARNEGQLVSIAEKHGLTGDAAAMLGHQFAMGFHGKSFDDWLNSASNEIDDPLLPARSRAAIQQLMDKSVEAADAVREMKSEGRLYEVEIPDDKDLLAWDAPLSAQPEGVRKAINKKFKRSVQAAQKSGLTSFDGDFDSMTGEQLYNALSEISFNKANRYAGGLLRDARKFAQETSLALREAGIPGHRYLDGGSRADGDGTYNYVVYDDAAVEVMGKESRFDPARRPDGRFATKAGEYSRQLLGDGGKITGPKERGLLGNLLTDAMGGKSDRYNTLALVPGEPLFQEMGKHLHSAQKYLRMKHQLAAMRNEMQAEASKFIDEWRGFSKKNAQANDRMMALMHDATVEGVDPAERFTMRPRKANEGKASYAAKVERKRLQHEELKKRFDRLPKEARDIYRKVRDGYKDMAKLERDILLENVAKAMEINVKRAEQRYEDTIRELDEDGITGEERAEKMEQAKKDLMVVKKRDGYGRKARLQSLRLMFEQNEVEAPYFPLMRHGNYYITVKNPEGEIVSFSKFETERARDQAAAQMRRDMPQNEVKVGAIDTKDSRMTEVDPNFMADVQAMIGATSADTQLMDSIWQRYLETLPDYSIRKSRLHRKGTPGYSRDAFRNYAKQMFHGAFQLSRLKYGQDMQLAMEDAAREARESSDPTRSTLVVNEMQKRHQWIMNPQTSAWSTWATSAAFVYYLGATPAAAMVNLSQSIIVGIPVLSAGYEKGTIAGAARHMMRGLREFSMAKGRLLNSKHLKPDEKEALQRAYDSGVIEKSQAHDLAGMQESGVEYSDVRQRMMRPIAYLFHHSERMNREITFIAAYRMAKESGQVGDTAYTNAARLTWKSHFNYESDSRPRLQFNDTIRVMTVFRNYQLNMLYRLFRDTHQMMQGETEADRKEARAQLIGITGMMMLMAGFTGTWGYALMTTLLGLFRDGGADEVEEEIKEALVNTLGVDVAGMILKGVPGHLAGVDLSARIGMPELWFRRAQRQEEGQELFDHWLEQLIGAVPAMGSSIFRGADMIKQGEVYRGIETAAPKFVRDYLRSYRYTTEGVTTFRGNPIIEDVSPMEAITQAIGFTPARVSERYQTNRFMKNEEMRIRTRRTRLMSQAYADIKEGKPLSAQTKRAIDQFNAEFPMYPIKARDLHQSFRARARGEIETVDGIRINARLDQYIREGRAPMLYN